MRFCFGHVLNHMRQEHGVKRVACRVAALLEIVGREGGEAGANARSNAGGVVIDAYAVAVEMRQITTDSAANVKHKARLHAPQIPAIWDLGIDDLA
jgi:hypothetical protein